MSSLVFVRDAQGRPLMPMSAAYARTLIHQGKAHMWPHPALSVIQLTRAVATPVLRPVLVGLALNRTTADLVFVIDQVRGSPSTMHMVIDLHLPRSRRQTRRTRWEPQRRIPRQAVEILQRPHNRVQVLLAVLKAWLPVLPVSHLILFPSARGNARIQPDTSWIERRLAARVHRIDASVLVVHHSTKLAGEVPAALLRYLEDQVVSSVHQAPQVIACVAPGHQRRDLEQRPSIRQRWKRRSAPLSELIGAQSQYALGHLCTTRQHLLMITGLLHALEPPDQLILRVPTQVTDQGVQWQAISVSITPALHIWPLTPIVMLPLIRT
jgi:hypothetical protein